MVFGTKMPTGFYTLLEKKHNYVKEIRYGNEGIQWLEYIMRTQNVHIRHTENGGEVRIENFVSMTQRRGTKQ